MPFWTVFAVRGIALLSLCAVAGCATQGGARAEINAVVQDEQSRQAAAAVAQGGEDSAGALKAGADAADRSKAEAQPAS